jgi:penicillin-binding protein 2
VTNLSRRRLFVLRVLIVSLLATLFGRLWYLQVMSGQKYQRAAQTLQTRTIVTPAPRGDILDDQGQELVENKTALVVSVNRTELSRQPDGGDAELYRLAAVTGVPYAELKRRVRLCAPHVPKPCWNGSPYQPIPVTEADTSVALQILEDSEHFPGVTAQVQAVRDYPAPAKSNAAHLVGHVGTITQSQLEKIPKAQRADHRQDQVGQDGLELVYDDALSGTAGHKVVTVNHVGSVTGTRSTTPPKSGSDLVTSLDAQAQHDLEHALHYALGEAHRNGHPHANTAAGALVDAKTGRIVAMASVPSYDPSLWVGGISTKAYRKLKRNKAYPLYDKAIQGEYAPGSTFKLVSTAGAVHEGTATLSGSYACPPYLKIGGRKFKNFESESFGSITLHQALVVSCDTVFYGFAERDYRRDEARIHDGKKPIEGVQHMARSFGLGSATGVDLPSESSGLIEGRAEKKEIWKAQKHNYCAGAKRRPKGSYLQRLDAENCKYGYLYNPGDQVNFDIGQGTVQVTPLQLACAYAALANGGTVFSPRIGKAVVRPDGTLVKRIEPKVRGHLPVSKRVLDYIKNAMYGVTHDFTGRFHGTGSTAFHDFPFDKVDVGGKTGTAEVGTTDKDQATAVFASFAGRPGKQPRYAAVIMVPKGGQGGKTAAPAMRKLWDGVFGLEGAKAAMPHGLPPSKLPSRGLSLNGQSGPSVHAQHGAGDGWHGTSRRSGHTSRTGHAGKKTG